MDATIVLLRRIATERPDDVATRLHLGVLLLERDEAQEALRWLDEARRTEPNNGMVLWRAGEAMLALGDPRGAVARLEAAHKTGLSTGPFRLTMARAYARVGDLARAEDAYYAAVAADAKLADADLLALIQGRQQGALAYDAGEPRRTAVDRFEAESPGISFHDVGGMDELKDHMRMSIVLPLQKPELFQAYGKRVGGGVLMFGPPGCGKTYLARALAGECSARFYMVGISEILDKWIGNSERNVHDLFEQARRTAPSIIFLDEIDVLGGKRGNEAVAALRGTVNQLLSEMDKVGDPAKPVLVIGATNTPWAIDTALKRPGRFDRVLFVPPPDQEARAMVLAVHLRGKPVQDIDIERVVATLDGYSGADLRAVVDRAAGDALRQAMKTGNVEPLTTQALVAAARIVRPSTAEWLAVARDYVKYANDAGFYDDVKEYLKDHH